MNKLLRVLLWPIAMLYGIGMYLRNKMFDIGFLSSLKVPIPTIVVGNLKVGGTGKTPFVEFLISHFLKEGKSICVLSRGYGRKTSGFRQADIASTSDEIGDEPHQYTSKYSGKGVKVFVGEDRVKAIETIHLHYPEVDIVILDDAFQHRSLRADRYFLLTEQDKPFYLDYVMPMGWLREFGSGARRADAVCITKTSTQFKEGDAKEMKRKLNSYVKNGTPVYFTNVKYLEPVQVNENQGNSIGSSIIVLAGIANSSAFVDHCMQCYDVKDVFEFSDHHLYSEKEIMAIVSAAQDYDESIAIVTTEKDKGRLLKFLPMLGALPLFYVPIEIEFLFNTEEELRTRLKSWF